MCLLYSQICLYSLKLSIYAFFHWWFIGISHLLHFFLIYVFYSFSLCFVLERYVRFFFLIVFDVAIYSSLDISCTDINLLFIT